jgi:hypothetical protein
VARTRQEREQERSDANHRYWETFRPKLAAVETYSQARALAASYPAPDKPGRLFHTNLLHVLQNSTVPNSSSSDERALFRAMLQRFVHSGEFKEEVLHRYDESLKTAFPAEVLPY